MLGSDRPFVGVKICYFVCFVAHVHCCVAVGNGCIPVLCDMDVSNLMVEFLNG